VVVLKKNVLHSALALIGSLSGVGALYAFLGADFLFAVQILVYVGGVTVLILFVILLSGRPSEWLGRSMNPQWFGALLVTALLIWSIQQMTKKFPDGVINQDSLSTTAPLGKLLLGPMLLPFEVVSLVLLAALVGAVFFTLSRSKQGTDESTQANQENEG